MDVRQIPLGAIPSPEDKRDYHIAMLTAVKKEFPANYKIQYPGNVKNQGKIGSCVAHSLSYVKEIIETWQESMFKLFSVGFIYANRKGTLSALFDEGMVPRDALKNLQKYGAVLYEDFPHYDTYKNLRDKITDDLFEKANPYRISTYCRLYTVEEIKTALMELGPVTMTVPVYPFFYRTREDGIVQNPADGEQLLGYHQMTIMGWRDDSKWIVLNSWGVEWGDNGYCYIDFDFPVQEYWSITDEIVADTGNFIEQIRPGAVQTYRTKGILPSLTMAQAILESNWGRNAPGYNLFGIKWSEGCGYDRQLLWTYEYVNGQWIKVQAYFRKYNSYAESMEDHANLFHTVRLANGKLRYQAVLDARDYKEACTAVQQCGYATDPDYAKKLISLVEGYALNLWDREGYRMYKDFGNVSDWAKEAVEQLNKLGIMIGDDKGNFNPKNAVTREELATVVYRVYQKLNSY